MTGSTHEEAVERLNRALTAAESAIAVGNTAEVGWRLALERITRLRGALQELLDVAERHHGGDPSLDPEEWYAARDYAKAVLRDAK